MIDAVLFDFDGTLADSSEGIFHTALYTVRKLGVDREYSSDDLRRFVGPPLRQCFVIAFSLDEALLDDAVAIYREEYERKGKLMMHLYPGMEAVLRELKAMGLRLGVASFKHRSLVRDCLERLGIASLFDTIQGSSLSEDLTKSDIINLALDELGAERSCTLMVGDTLADLDGAENAGTLFAGVSYGFGFKPDETANGFRLFSSPVALLPFVKSMNGGYMIERIETKAAPAAIGPYSQAVKANGMVFASGQIPINPETGAIVEGSAAEQAEQVFKNIKAVLSAAGTDMPKVVKATVFLADMADFGAVNEVYSEAFKDSPVLPARSAVAVKTLPKNVQVEIEVIALA